ncbi:MAG: prepilin peptidase [Proteobacteria bacterium]|nr:prepilin peptidase [Pseudomonadota bacterium]MBT5819162.1 prepilin peptidase [Pseudomonadota bacterium]MBT6348178.1 prepilin peptidase [Pseudomonadota bacterium]
MVGSFLNVVIARVPQQLQWQWRGKLEGLPKPAGVAGPVSRCPSCQQPIRWRDNLPLISFLILKGRCRSCNTAISGRYPLVEALCAGLSLVVVIVMGAQWTTLAALIFTWGLIALTFIDLEHFLLPDRLTLPLLAIGLGVNAVNTFTDLISALVGAIAGYGSFWIVFHGFRIVTGKEGMGHGDFKLLAALGAWMGWQMLPLIILLSAGTGAIIGITMLILQQHQRGQQVPFGPYLAGAGWLALLWGVDFNHYYLKVTGL